jgi:phenylalanyl-tRNA synthetase beta chain
MKIPLEWLADYVPITIAPAELTTRLTRAGLEVAAARIYGLPVPTNLQVKLEEPGPVWLRDKIVVAQVLEVTKHPNADTLKLVTLDHGAPQPKVVVTAAQNIKIGDKGQKVLVGLAGTVCFDGHATPKRLMELKPRDMRGVPSDSMVMSELELGISDEHEGIIFLDPADKVGTPAADLMGDIVLEVDVLPNMARCLGMLGVAREVAALTGQTITPPKRGTQATGPQIASQVTVKIEAEDLCARYAAGLLTDVKIGPSPYWMQRRLRYAGMRPISNIVDVTNYVMLEYGQPLHAFDYDVLLARAKGKPPTIIVRRAREDEVLKTLDGVERKLTPDMLVIADTAGAIALAGVMGGAETEVSATTKRVLLESANFDPVCIRRTARGLELNSEASYRFTRGIHPEVVLPALERAAELMRSTASATICAGVVDSYPRPLPDRVVSLPMSEVTRILGVAIPREECARLLRTLDFGVKESDTGLTVTLPHTRVDIQEGPSDLIEEIARLHGYDNLPSTLLADQLPEPLFSERIDYEERLRDILVDLGLQEAVTYALTTTEAELRVGPDVSSDYVTLLNPISSDRTVLRHMLLPGLLDALDLNLKHVQDVRLFEVGTVFLGEVGQQLPDEPRKLGLALCGRRGQSFWADGADATSPPLDFYDLKGIIEGLLEALHVPDVTYERGLAAWLHPARCAKLVADGLEIGQFGQLHPRVARHWKNLNERVVLVGELEIDALCGVTPVRYPYRPVSEYEVAKRDVALVVADAISNSQIEAVIREAGGGLLQGIELFDVYRGENIPPGHKSVAYALTYQAPDRTLKDKEIEQVHKTVQDRLKEALQAQIREPKNPK